MDDFLPALSVCAPLFASGLYTVCNCWWRRRHPAPPSPYTHQALRLAEQGLLTRTEAVIDSTYASVGSLYDRPEGQDPAIVPTPVRGAAGTSPDRGRSQPAPGRTR